MRLRITIMVLALITLAGQVLAAKVPTLAEQFKHPGPEYRPAPFFSLNDDLKADELAAQIRDMRAHGYGGAFLHARVGRITPYMSDEWLDDMARCVKESKAVGNYAWLYDEDRWPSGFASGMVPAKGVEYRAKTLGILEFDAGKDTRIELKDGQLTINGLDNVLALFSCTKAGSTLNDLKRIPMSSTMSLKSGAHILMFRKIIAQDSPGFNGFSYVDTLEPKIIKAFIDSTYEPYFKKLGADFGKAIPGIFTDEPSIAPTAWTESLPDQFQKRYGYDLLDFLPSLYYEVGDWQRIRYDYRSLTCDMFVEAYSKQLYDWCAQHNLKFTGHYLAEDSLLSQLKRVGAVMPHYEYEQMPGIDHLFRKLGEVVLIKQVSSVANQLGKKRVLSETWGGSGWNTSFADQRWIVNWQLALGVNFMTPHLAQYSLRGTRKRDWPASIYFQQPYWKYYNSVNDYIARACTMLTRGDFIADVLVIHPIASVWSVYSPQDESRTGSLNNQFKSLGETLVAVHREFEYGDEKLMAKYAKVEGKDFVVGKMRYKTVIVPPSITLSSTTLRLLKSFADAGGVVIAMRPTPTRLDGVESPEVRQFFERKQPNLVAVDDIKSELVSSLQTASPSGISVKDALGLEQPHIVCHRRQDGNRQIIFLANTDPTESYHVTVKVDKAGKVEEWNLENGSIAPLQARTDGSGTSMDLRIPGGGAKLLVVDQSAKLVPSPASDPSIVYSQDLSDAWKVKRHSPNSLTLDYCQYRIGDGEWKGPVPVYQVQQEMERQPDGTQVTLRFTFNMGLAPTGAPIHLALEQPAIYTVTVNGQPISSKDAGWWVDKSFRKLDIGKAIHAGDNTIEMSCKFVRPTKPGTLVYLKNGVEIESVYIVGDFAVEAASDKSDGPAGTTVMDGPFKLVAETPVPIIGDLTAAGYPFFAGDIELSQDLDVSYMPEGQAYLEFSGLDAIVAKVYVNGKDAGAAYWPPYRVDVTPYLEKGANRIQVLLSNSLRNLLGPLHNKKGELTAASPGSFTDGKNWTDSYHFVKLGIPGKARIAWEE